VIFGATSSPYILGAALEKNILSSTTKTVNLYTQSTHYSVTPMSMTCKGRGDEIDDVKRFKKEATLIMKEGGFNLYK
jgi:hypothetical protein